MVKLLGQLKQEDLAVTWHLGQEALLQQKLSTVGRDSASPSSLLEQSWKDGEMPLVSNMPERNRRATWTPRSNKLLESEIGGYKPSHQ